jgi:mono/diheme cytochrome c family protein
MNITHDTSVGIGKWTDGELAYFLRTGVRSDGSYAPAYMPKFPLLSDEDLYSVIAWLRSDAPSLQASKVEPQKTKPSFLTKALTNVVMKPYPFPKETIKQPDTTNQLAWGKYLASNLYGCFACHSADFAKNNDLKPEESEGFYAGGNKLIGHKGEDVFSKNITPDATTGIGSWTEEDFITALRTGKRKNGKMFAYPMVPYTRLTDSELKAMFAYLKTVPAISNKVEENN